MIVWGGFGTLGGYENSGGRYNPVANTWQITSTNAATVPAQRNSHTAVWTGAEMIVWGGIGSNSTNFNSGGRYNPTTDIWIATTTNNAPQRRYSHTAVWTGTDMIVWGGYNNNVLNNGGRFKTNTLTWTNTTLVGAPSPRYYHTAVWTGTEMIVWGGYGATTNLGNGGRYNPGTDTWILVPNSPPTVSLTAPANGATFAAPATVFLSATANDTDGTVTQVDFYNGTNLLGTDFTSGYDFTWTNVAVGSYSLTARATDNGGLIATSSVVNITVFSNNPPSVSLTAPANNALFNSPASVPLSANASDSDGIAKVDYYQNSNYIATVTVSPYNYTWSGVSPGIYNLTAKATDNLNLASTSAVVQITVDNRPTVTLTAPAHNAVFPVAGNILLSANPADSDGTIAKVEFFRGAILIGTVTSSPWDFNWTSVAAGVYNLTATATDNLGLAQTSSVAQITVELPPTVTLNTPTNNAFFTVPGPVALSASPTDTDGTVAKVEFFQGATLLGTVTSSPWNFTWANVASGTYNITARATDNLGLAATSGAAQIIVDAPPTVSLYNPTNNAVYIAPATVYLNAFAADTDGTVTKVEFYYGTNLIGTDFIDGYDFAWTNVLAGSYSLTARATDNGGVISTSSVVNITVNTNVAPIVTLTAPTPNGVFALPGAVPLNANASDADSSIARVDFFEGLNFIGTVMTLPYTNLWTGMASGTYNITARATDNLGLMRTSSVVQIVVDAPPTVSLVNPLTSTVLAAPANTTLTATPYDSDGIISQVNFFANGNFIGMTNGPSYTLTWTNVPSGAYNLTATAVDNNGLWATSAPVMLTVDALPTVAFTYPTNNGYVPTGLVPLSVNAADADGSVSQVQFFLNGGLFGSAGTAPFSLTWSNPAIGNYNLSAVATDNLGLSKTSSPVNVFVALRPGIGVAAVSNKYLLTVTGEVSRVYRVLASTNLVNWVPISTNTTSNGVFSIIDTNASPLSRRFWRATPEP